MSVQITTAFFNKFSTNVALLSSKEGVFLGRLLAKKVLLAKRRSLTKLVLHQQSKELAVMVTHP